MMFSILIPLYCVELEFYENLIRDALSALCFYYAVEFRVWLLLRKHIEITTTKLFNQHCIEILINAAGL